MSDDYQRIEIITAMPRRRRWTAEQKLRIVEESHQSGESIPLCHDFLAQVSRHL